MREGAVFGGRYRVRGTLGSGGMAVVYEAEDAILRRRVALKTLHERYAEDESFRARFRHEARAMASLDHENIVKVYDISEDGEEAPFIVAECVGGGDIGVLLKEAPDGRLKESFVREISRQLLKALAYAHRRGVIHRDVKPSNILVTREGTVKVADFGIARIVEDEDQRGISRVGEPGEIVGSARYMSPEQLRGEETTPRSDIYSVGVFLYHCLTGRPPFLGDARGVARQQLHSEPLPPRKLNRGVSRGMEAVILKALQKNPVDRYASAAAMLDDLMRETDSGAATAAGRTPGRPGVRRGGVLAGAAALALLLGGGGIAAANLGYTDLGGLTVLTGSDRRESASAPADRPAGRPVEQAPVEASSPEAAPEDPREEVVARETPTAQQQQQQVAREPVAVPEEEEFVPEGSVSEEVAREGPVEEAAPAEEQGLVPVPSVDTYFDYSAREILENRGFEARVVYQYKEGYADRGVAWGTDPAVGTLVPYGSTITVYATPVNEYQPQIQT